jgi:hypothetical protein
LAFPPPIFTPIPCSPLFLETLSTSRINRGILNTIFNPADKRFVFHWRHILQPARKGAATNILQFTAARSRWIKAFPQRLGRIIAGLLAEAGNLKINTFLIRLGAKAEIYVDFSRVAAVVWLVSRVAEKGTGITRISWEN